MSRHSGLAGGAASDSGTLAKVGLAQSGLFALVIVAFLYRRVRQLRDVAFHLNGPNVPDVVLDEVRGAETQFYRHLGFVRRRIEDIQDVLCFISPGLIFAVNASVGPYRLKARTVASLLDYAVEQRYLTMALATDRHDTALLAYFSMQPVINQWQAALLLQHLKDQHPQLAPLPWASIAADRRLIAKLYSGYMGAGGDWAGWAATLEPGNVARARLHLD